jgi:hypothetical protein
MRFIACVFIIGGLALAPSAFGQTAQQHCGKAPEQCNTFIGRGSAACKEYEESRVRCESFRARSTELWRRFKDAEQVKISVPQPIERYCDGNKIGKDCPEASAIVSLYAIRDRAVIVAHGTYQPGQLQLCTSSKGEFIASSRCDAIKRALVEGREKYQGPEHRQIQVLVRGHADIVPAEITRIDGAMKDKCDKAGATKNIEDCIALARAHDMESVVGSMGTAQEKLQNRYVPQFTYDRDPFMETTNSALQGSLFEFLKIGNGPVNKVAELKREIGVPEGATTEVMRESARGKKLNLVGPLLGKQLENFRSVVVVLQPCQGFCQ